MKRSHLEEFARLLEGTTLYSLPIFLILADTLKAHWPLNSHPIVPLVVQFRCQVVIQSSQEKCSETSICL